MKFGMLQITLPDGKVRDYALDQPTVSLGRAPGNDLIIDDTSVSRRHARLMVESGRVLIEDLGSANGTYINHQRLAANTSNLVPDNEVICVGDVEIRFSPPPPIVTPPPTTEQVGPPLAVSLVGPGQPVAPGSAVTATLTVQNRSAVVDELLVSVSGIPTEWVRLSKDRVPLLPHAQETLTLTFAPPRRSEAVATAYTVVVTVTSREQRTSVAKSAALKVLPFQAFALSLEPARSRGDFQVLARNDGNTPAAYRFRGHDDEQALFYQFKQDSATFQPGQLGAIALQVSPKIKPRVGSREMRAFSVIAVPIDGAGAEATATGQLIIRPPIPVWLITLAVLLTALACAGLAAVYGQICGSLGPNLPLCPAAAKPSIAVFTAVPTEVRVGEAVAIQWDVANAEKVELIAPFQDTLPGSRGVKTYTVDQNTNFTLRATNFAGSDERTVAVKVLVIISLPEIQRFTAEPAIVTAQVKQVTLNWIVAGASAVSIEGVPGANLAATGSVSIEPPTTDRTYVLIATNAAGTVSRTLTLPVQAATCVTRQAMSLRTGPLDKYDSIADLPAQISLLPNGRSTTAEWVRVQVPQLQKEGWLKVADIICDGWDILALAVVSPGEYPPVPTDVPVPVAVPANLTGLTVDQAANELTAIGLIAGSTVSEAHDTIPKDHVIRTEPPAGALIARTTRVTLYVSSGPAPVVVPATIIGMAEANAVAELNVYGLVMGASQSERSDTVSAGCVIRTDPPPGTSVARGTAITLYVASGPEHVTVPNVSGLSADEAAARLQANELIVGSTTTELHPTIGRGLVIRTEPPGDTIATPGTTVVLVVSRGTGQRQITVTFTQAYIHDDGDDWTRGMGEVWFNFNVNGQTARWPASGTRDLDGGHAYAINVPVTVVIPETGTLSIFVKGTEDDSPDANDDMGTVSQQFFDTANWGQGAHNNRSTCPDGCYTIYYTIDVIELP